MLFNIDPIIKDILLLILTACDGHALTIRFANIDNKKFIETVVRNENGFSLKDIREETLHG